MIIVVIALAVIYHAIRRIIPRLLLITLFRHHPAVPALQQLRAPILKINIIATARRILRLNRVKFIPKATSTHVLGRVGPEVHGRVGAYVLLGRVVAALGVAGCAPGEVLRGEGGVFMLIGVIGDGIIQQIVIRRIAHPALVLMLRYVAPDLIPV